jgi:hypothetical protein
MSLSDEELTKVVHEYGNTDIETLIEHFGQNKRSQRFKLIPGQEFLSTLDDRMMICSNGSPVYQSN